MRRLITFLTTAAAAVPAVVHAQTTRIQNPLGIEDLGGLFDRLAQNLTRLAIPIAAVLYIWAGFLYLTAGAKPENIQKAKKALLYTTIGLVVIFIGSGFVDLIRSLLNLG